jgi:hypothetical protein
MNIAITLVAILCFALCLIQREKIKELEAQIVWHNRYLHDNLTGRN